MKRLPKCLLLLLTLLTFFIAHPAQAQLAVGMKAIERGHYATAERALRKAAVKGDLRAQNNLGYLYENGLGIAQDYTQALQWYSRAAEGGLPDAQYNLATLYHYGRGVAQNHKAAFEWFSESAGAGFADAQYMMGESLRVGWGTEKDGVSALSWYLKAAKKAHASAQLMAGYIYLSGEGWRSEPQKAVVWAELARINGEPQAAALLSKAGKKMPGKDLPGALQLAQVCLLSGYRDCPE